MPQFSPDSRLAKTQEQTKTTVSIFPCGRGVDWSATCEEGEFAAVVCTRMLVSEISASD